MKSKETNLTGRLLKVDLQKASYFTVGYEAEGNCGCRGYPLNTTDFHRRKCNFLSNVFKESDIQSHSFNFFNLSICDEEKTKHVQFMHVDALKIIFILKPIISPILNLISFYSARKM